MYIVNKSILKKVYRKRAKDTHKYDYGSLLVVGGSKLYSGSPGFATLSAYRSGVDLVTVAAPERAANIIAGFSPDMITYPLKGDYLRKEHLKELLSLAKNKSAVIIGGGLERRKETLKAVSLFLKKISLPCVIDADAIYALNKNIIYNRPFVITPHAYEFYILTKEKVKKDLKQRIKQVKKFAKKYRTTILLKGHVDIISNEKYTAINKTGCPELTVGGTGDTLVGILGSLIAQKNNLFDSACAAAYINGKAGELAAKNLGESVTATDLINNIYKVIR